VCTLVLDTLAPPLETTQCQGVRRCAETTIDEAAKQLVEAIEEEFKL
jgi:hypothetical protein